MIATPPMADGPYGLNQGSQGGMPQQGISRNPARGNLPRPLRKYESQGAMVKPPLKDSQLQSFDSAPSPASSQEKVFKSSRGSFRRTFSLKSEKFLRRLNRGRSSDSKLNSSENDEDLFNENDEDGEKKASSRPRGLMRVGTMPAMRLHMRRGTNEYESDDSLSLTRNENEGSLWNVVKSRVGIGSFNFSRTNSQGSSSSIEALSPPAPGGGGDVDDQVDAVYQVLKQGAMLRASEKTEDDPFPLHKQSSTDQTSLDESKDEDDDTQSANRGETNNKETGTIVTTKLTKQLSKGGISNPAKSKSSQPEQSQESQVKGEKKSELKKSKPEKGRLSSTNGFDPASSKNDFADIVLKVMDGGSGV